MGSSRGVNTWAHHVGLPVPRRDEVVNRGECDANIALKWMTEVSSSVYGTPLIHDLYSDGQKDVIVPSFVHYLEARALLLL